MGIDGFNKVIKEQYFKSFSNFWYQYYDYVYIDINFCLHNVNYISKNENDLINRLNIFIFNLILKINPRKKLILVTDGPAPYAKLLLQRKRRLFMSKSNESENFSSLNFTPGTKFMQKINLILNNLILKVSYLYNVEVILLTNGPGEGEIKIKDHLNNINLKKNSACVVSNDADVIVMLMNLKYIHNVFILHKSSSTLNFINLGILLDIHTNIYSFSLKPGNDFTFLNLMLGNDYIPKIIGLNFEKLWSSYKKTLNKYPIGLFNKKNDLEKLFLVELMNQITIQTKQMVNKKFYFKLYSKSLYKNYLEGLLWCYELYTTGKCKNYKYIYGFSEPPHSIGLTIYLNSLESDLISNDNNEISYPLPDNLYSILLLPYSHKDLISEEYHSFIEKLDILYENEKQKEKSENNDSKINKIYQNIDILDIDDIVEKFYNFKY